VRHSGRHGEEHAALWRSYWAEASATLGQHGWSAGGGGGYTPCVLTWCALPRSASQRVAPGDTANGRCPPPLGGVFRFKINPEFGFSHGKNRLAMRKHLGKFIEVGNPIWNTFCYCNFFPFSTDFELIQRFQFKFELPKFCSLRLIVTSIANPPELKREQGILHVSL
jgi:hypothetical protein